MRKLAMSILIAAMVAPGPVLAAASNGGGGGTLSSSNSAAGSGVNVDDLLRRVERDLDRLNRGLDNDVAHIEKKQKSKAKPAPSSPQPPSQ